MSSFWDNNKGTIYSGFKGAGRMTWKGSKAVAKAGKQSFNSQKKTNAGKPGKPDGEADDLESRPSYHAQTYRDPMALPPPPVRPEQMQTHGSQQQLNTAYQQVNPPYQHMNPPYQQQQQQQPIPPYGQQPLPPQPYQQPPSMQQLQPQPYQQPVSMQQPLQSQPYQQQQPLQSQSYQQLQPDSTYAQQPQPPAPPQQTYQQNPSMQQPLQSQSYQQQQPLQSQSYQQLQPDSTYAQQPQQPQPSAPPQQTYQQNPSVQQPQSQPQQYYSDPNEQNYYQQPQQQIAAQLGQHFQNEQNTHPPTVSSVPQPASNPVPQIPSRENYYANSTHSVPPPNPQYQAMSQPNLMGPTAQDSANSSGQYVNPYESVASPAVPTPTLNTVDVTALPPPPVHKARGIGVPTENSSQPSLDGQEQGSNNSAKVQSPPVALPSRETTNSAQQLPLREPSTNGIQHNDQAIENVPDTGNSGITGKYEPQPVNYAPPPKPFRRATNVSQPSDHRTIVNKNATVPSSQIHRESEVVPALRPIELEPEHPETTSNSMPSVIDSYPPPPKPFRNKPVQSTTTPNNGSMPMNLVRPASRNADSDHELPKPPTRQESPIPQKPFTREERHEMEAISQEENGKFTDHVRKPKQPPVPKKPSALASVESKKSPPPVLKPKPQGIEEKIKSRSASQTPVSELSNELANFKLRKTENLEKLEQKQSDNASNGSTIAKKTPPPVVPRKQPPLPVKNLNGSNNTEINNDANVDDNPFARYLKSAVPTEVDRFHRK